MVKLEQSLPVQGLLVSRRRLAAETVKLSTLPARATLGILHECILKVCLRRQLEGPLVVQVDVVGGVVFLPSIEPLLLRCVESVVFRPSIGVRSRHMRGAVLVAEGATALLRVLRIACQSRCGLAPIPVHTLLPVANLIDRV